MKTVKIADATLCREDGSFSFKERIEIARQLERLKADAILLPAVRDERTDVLLVRTVSSFVKESVLSVAAGLTEQSVDLAAAALSNAAHPAIRISLPVSPVGMEYTCHKKAPKMLEWITAVVTKAKAVCPSVEFCAEDATRAEEGFLARAITAAVAAGASSVTLCDSAAELLPDDFAVFVQGVADTAGVPVGVRCDNRNGLAAAESILAVRESACSVVTSVGGDFAPLETVASVLKNCGSRYGLATGLRVTELGRIIRQINWIFDGNKNAHTAPPTEENFDSIRLDKNDDRAAVVAAVSRIGYDLSEEDVGKVYEEFLRVAEKKNVGAKELDAIVASVAMQVPSAYKLVSYVINTGNVLNASAQVTLLKDGEEKRAIEFGDGPIDAALHVIDKIVGRHYELDDFQIQAVTEGKEAMGATLVKLRSNGKLYSGNGISTDIIGASIRAYLNAVNKILYEEG